MSEELALNHAEFLEAKGVETDEESSRSKTSNKQASVEASLTNEEETVTWRVEEDSREEIDYARL